MTQLDHVKKFVDDSFGSEIPHFEQTLYWLLKLKPDADEAMQIAAYGHDIHRAFGSKEMMEKIENTEGGFKNPEMLRIHQNDGAKILGDYLESIDAEKSTIRKVTHLISKHEVGGDEDQNLIKDADSISYFETNAEHFVTKFLPKFGKQKIKKKFDWMFERISSDEAKLIAQPMYEKSIQLLNSASK